MSTIYMEHEVTQSQIGTPPHGVKGWEAQGYKLYTRYVWSIFASNPVEHISHTPGYMDTLCGAVIKRMTFAIGPSGLAPVCSRCERKEKALQAEAAKRPTDALDMIAEAYNSGSATSQDIINAVSKALQHAGYTLKY